MQAEQQSEMAFPFYELRFIMRVLSHEGKAPREDWKTAYGMAREIFVRWIQDQQSERERFEAWCKQENPRYEPTDDSPLNRRDWKIWQAALSHPSTPQWQPIESAPKDGAEIVGAEWQQPCVHYPQELFTQTTQYSEGAWRYPSGVSWTPTHWMPLPPPPEQGSSNV